MTIADIVTKSRKLVDADSTSYTDALLLIDINSAYEEIAAKILGYDGRWQWDDTNYTDFPEGRADLVAGQKDYSFDTTHLKIERVSVLDANGDERYLTPLDRRDLSLPWNEYFPTDGTPEFYDKEGISVILGPGPAAGSVTLTNGLKVYFRRTADVFTAAQVTTGTKVPGFASPFHKLICYKAILDYAMSYKKDRVAGIMAMIKTLEDAMEDFYTKRDKDENDVITMAGIRFR